MLNTKQYQTITDNLLVRKNKKLTGKILGSLRKGTIVEVIKINKDYALINYNNSVGYVLSSGLMLYQTEITGEITIQYIDEASNTELTDSVTHSNLPLGTYTYEAKVIAGYQLSSNSPITVTLTDSNPNQTLQFNYQKQEEVITPSLDESLQNEVPYISTYYIKPIVAPEEEVIIDYYITDYYHKEYTNDDYSDTFTVIVHIEDYPDIIIKDLKAGDHSVSLGKFTIEREQKFSILCEDQYGRHSHELFNFFLVRTEPEVKEYIMTDEDLITYHIKNTDDYEELLEVPLTLETINATTVQAALKNYADSYTPKQNTYTCFLPKTSEDDDPARWWNYILTKYADDYDKTTVEIESQNTRLGLQNLLDDKAAQGYNKLKLLPGTYRVDYTGTLYIPTQFTLDMNGATLKLNPFTGAKALMIELNNTFDSHVINGTIEGDYYGHDYANSTNNSEWVNGVSIGGESKYSSFKNLTIKNITGYGSTNGIANSRDGNMGYTYLYPQAMGDTFKLGDIDTKTGLDRSSINRTTSDFKAISGYSELGYLSISIYLGYQGNPCGTWNFICHFYDKNKNYLQSIHSYQYRRIGVPENAQYIRITILNEAYPTNLSIQLFRIPTHCSFKQIKYDNCRCVGSAPAAMKDMLIEECEFTRCGRSGAFCALDAEDGWDMMQDITYRTLNFYNNIRNDFLTCAGHNFIVENQIAGSQYIWARTRNLIVRNCTVNTATYHDGDIVYHGIYQIYNNHYENPISTNNNLVKYCSGKQINGYVSHSNLMFIGNGTYQDCTFTYSDETPPYLLTCNLKNCVVTSNDLNTECNLRFNSDIGPFYFENVTFKNKTYLNSNNNFSNANFNCCTFEDMRMKVLVSENNNLIVFNDCQINCNSSSEFIFISPFVYSKGITNIQFLNCTLAMKTDNTNFRLIYGYAKAIDSSYQFNNCKINQSIGTILDVYPSYNQNFNNFHIIFNYCNKISVPYSTTRIEDLINSTIYITENNPV